jgi:hypothetical protein
VGEPAGGGQPEHDHGRRQHDAEGVTGPVKVIMSIVERSNIEHIVDMIKQHNPQAFYSVEDVRFVSEAVTPHRLPGPPRWERFVSRMRKREE